MEIDQWIAKKKRDQITKHNDTETVQGYSKNARKFENGQVIFLICLRKLLDGKNVDLSIVIEQSKVIE